VDNRCTLHMAVPDHDHRQPRVMYRTTVTGTPSGRILNEDSAAAARRRARLGQKSPS
jgi:taurine dioxygenase